MQAFQKLAPVVEKEKEKEVKEVWYHEGPAELQKMRLFMADFSLPRCECVRSPLPCPPVTLKTIPFPALPHLRLVSPRFSLLPSTADFTPVTPVPALAPSHLGSVAAVSSRTLLDAHTIPQ